MRDVVREQEAIDQVESSSGLATVGPKAERALSLQLAQLVEDFQVGEQVERVVLVGRIVGRVPVARRRQRSLQARKTFL